MSNFNREKSKNNFINIDYDIDYWEIFQSETDETRNLLLNYLTKKCDIHKEEEYLDPNIIDLFEFKSTKNFHFEECRNYLFISEKRRNPFKNGKLLYSKNPCQNFMKKISCSKGEICEFSHNQLEILFHPYNFRKQICRNNECEKNKIFCFNAHRNQDKRKFPFSMKNSFHSKEQKNFNNIQNGKDSKNDLNYNDSNNNHQNLEKNNEMPHSELVKNDKDNMLNQLNFDIKNLLDEVDFDDLDEDDLIKDEEINLNESKIFWIKIFRKKY